MNYLRVLASVLLLNLCTQRAGAIIDTNENGLSDLWEKAYNNGDLLPETLDPQADPDGDGWTNAQEAVAGTDPFDANAPLGHVRPDILYTPATYSGVDANGDPILVTPEAVTITWPTIVGKLYTLQFSPNLQAGTWINVQEPVLGDGTPISIATVLTQPDGSVPPELFWHVSIADVDSDNDGMVNSEEAAIDSNPDSDDADFDADNDGLTTKEEAILGTNAYNENSDGDSLNDFADAAPNESLIDWPRTSESAYAMIEIDAPSAASAPQDLTDDGEVLFGNGRWKNGNWTSLDSPMKTGSFSSSEGPIGYEEQYYSWNRMNSDLQAIGSMTITFTSGHPAGGDPLTSSCFGTPSAASPVNLTDSLGLWNTLFPDLRPVGISRSGQIVVIAKDNSPTSPKYFRRLDANGLDAGRMDGTGGYEPLGSSGTGYCDVVPTGWVASRLHKQGIPIDRVALWRDNNTEVTLPEEANSNLYPINLSDLPGERVALNCGVTFQNHTLASRIFLPDGTGTYRCAQSLTWERIQLFAGDGTGITFDGKIWRNGRTVSLKKLSGLYNQRQAQGYEITPVRANGNGVYLVSMTSPQLESKGALLYPIQFLKADGMTASELKVGKMVDTNINALVSETGEVSASKLNIELDPDRFYIRIPGLNGSHDVKVKLGTADNPDPDYNDDPTWVELTEKDGYYESRSQLLVSGDVDDDHSNVTFDLGEDDPSAESNLDRTHKVQLGGYVQITAVKLDGIESSCFMELPVKVKKTVTVNVVSMDFSGATPEKITLDFKAANERYAQVGLKLKRGSTHFRTAESISGFPRSLRDGAFDSSANTLDVDTSGEVDLAEKARMLIQEFGTSESNEDIHVFYVESCFGANGANQGVSLPEFAAEAYPEFSNNAFVSRNHNYFMVLAHELGHLLTNQGHWGENYGSDFPALQVKQNLMRGEGANFLSEDAIWKTKRLSPMQQNMIWSHRAVK